MNYMAHATFMQGARTLIENAASIPEVSSALSAYGYTEARFKEGRDLLEAADSLSKKKSAELGDKLEATSDFSSAWDKANVAYVKTLKIARIALGDDDKCVAALKLAGVRKQTFNGWSEQADTFYGNILGEKRLVTRLGRFGYSTESLEAERGLVLDAMAKRRLQARESGESHASTVARDKKLAELDDYVSDLRAVCEVAFYDDRVELEKLGPLAPVRRKRQAKKPAAAVTT